MVMRRIGLALLVLVLAACSNPDKEGSYWYMEQQDGVWMGCWVEASEGLSAMACEPLLE